MKVYILIENFEKDYNSVDGYVNVVFADKSRAEEQAQRLMESQENYTCKVIERDVFL